MDFKLFKVAFFTLALSLVSVQSAAIKQAYQTASFMVKFGYMDDDGKNRGPLDPNSAEFRSSIRSLQRFGNIPVTGQVDAATINLINTDRCGVKDPPSDGAGRFTLQGSRWKRTDITYRILNYTKDGIPISQQRRIFKKAFDLWQSASALRIREVYSGDADILISFVRQKHGDPFAFDRRGGTLAHAFYPHNNRGLSGDAHFDDDEHFTTGTKDGINLDWVAVHEFGHSLGLEHSNVKESIMYPWYKGYVEDIKLTNDDTQGIQSLYPMPTPRRIIPTTKITTTVTTTRHQSPTPRPTAPTPSIPVICRSTVRYDTVFVGTNRWTFFVVGDKFWIVDRQLRRRGPYTITSYYRDIKVPLDAAYLNKKGNVVFFKGSEFWEYDSKRVLRNSGQITRYGLPSALANMDAVFTWERNKKTYLFKDTQYWRYNEDTQSTDWGYPKGIKNAWRSLPNHINAAVRWVNGRTYIFRGKQYLKLQHRKVYMERGYPQEIAKRWMKCNSGDEKDRGFASEDP
ncbi:72 kDa type IV collagenase-like isoform X1 [Stylophora pistillata]|uniref:72 kDa type IV collagenase-like isoform X1 n=1 Tax=Stylophora pistillata TaxID=50429 RepID=UPI000C053CCD|nr:72 kDa type IV collagenase-like isoform X1 [Stylophora pistillata]